jgi:hypothetical protein
LTSLRGLSIRANYTDRLTTGLRVSRGQRNGSPHPCFRISSPEPLLFLPTSSSIVLTRLSGPRSRPTTCQNIWYRRESNTWRLKIDSNLLFARLELGLTGRTHPPRRQDRKQRPLLKDKNNVTGPSHWNCVSVRSEPS